MEYSISLSQLGWKPFFQQQLTLDDWQNYIPARIMEHHRSIYQVLTEQGIVSLNILSSMPAMSVGDWLLLDSQKRWVRLLERSSLFLRKAPGEQFEQQLIAANIDTVFIVSSLNQDFNLNRIERYLSLANQAGVMSLLVLTKADLCEEPDIYVQKLRAVNPMLMVIAINALDANCVEALMPWCGDGQTIALLGSSGVGKSTILNTLLGNLQQATAEIRFNDGKGRHTTTARSMHFIPNGGTLIDTPGMRELQLADCEQGVRKTFADIEQLAAECRFSDCQHQSEPGCAVQEAITSGKLHSRRLQSYIKILNQQAFNAAGIAERRARDRELGRYYRSVQQHSRKQKKVYK